MAEKANGMLSQMAKDELDVFHMVMQSFDRFVLCLVKVQAPML